MTKRFWKFMSMSVLTLIMLLGVVLVGCDNWAARQFGGTMKVEIAANRKLVNVTWKDSDLWILTRPRLPGEKPVRYEFNEDSTMGMMEGTVILIELK